MFGQGLYYSSTVHLIILLLAIFGLPEFLTPTPDPEPMVIAVELVPISEITNIKKSKKLVREDKKSKEKPKEPEKKKAPTKSEDKKPEKKKENLVKIQDKKKKAEKKKEPKKKDEKKPEDDAILKDKKKPEDDKKTDKKKVEDKKTAKKSSKSDKEYDSTIPMSLSERDAIVGQFVKCWRVPAGSASDYNLLVKLQLKIRRDGYVTSVDLPSSLRGRYGRDTFFRAAVYSAVRAVKKCNPLKNLPPKKYDTWKETELTFNPKDLLY